MNVSLLLRILGDPDDAQQAIRTVGREMVALAKKRARATVEVATERAQARVRQLHGELLALAAGDYTVTVELRERLSERLLGMRRALSDTRVQLGLFNVSLRTLGTVFAVALPLAVSLVAGLISLAASAGAAALGLGAVGIAAAAALGPLLLLAAAAISRFSQAGDAVDQVRQAMERLKAAQDAYAEAERAVSAAENDAEQAAKALVAAREQERQQAQEELRSALDQLRAAEDTLSDAQGEQLAAQQALTAAREQATQALVDMRRAADNAATSEKRARIELTKARNELERMEAQGANGAELRDQRLRVEEAENSLADARLAGRRSQEELNQAEREGVQGAEAVQAALTRIAEANVAVAEAVRDRAAARREISRAESVEIRKAESVIAARRAEVQAYQQVRSAERDLASAAEQLAKSQADANEAMQAAARLAPAAAEALRRSAQQAFGAFQAATRGGSDAVFRGIANFLSRLRPVLAALTPDFTQLGRAIGNSFARAGAELARPIWVTFFRRVTQAASQIVPLLTTAFLALWRVLRNIATAAMPYLIAGIERFAAWAQSIAKASGNGQRMNRVMAVLAGHLKSWFNLAKAAGGALLQLFRAAAPAGQRFVRWLTKGIREWTRWAASVEGQKQLREFFDRLVSIAQKLVKLFVKLAELALEFSEVMAPLLDPVLDVILTGLGLILDVVDGLLDLFRKLPGPIQTVLAGLLLFRRLKFLKTLFSGLTLLPGLLGKAFSKLPGIVTGAGRALGTLFSKASGAASRLLPLIGRIGPALLRIAGPAGLATAAALEWGDDLGKGFASLLGYSDDAIEASERLADKQGRVADRIYTVYNSLGARLRAAISNLGGLPEVLNTAQLKEAQRVFATQGAAAGRAYVDRLVGKARERLQTFRQVGDQVGRALSAGVASTSSAVAQAVASITGKAVEKARQRGKAMVSIGQSLGLGLANGLLSVAANVASAAQTVADQIAATVADDLQVQSPSKVMARLGEHIGEGLALGIDSSIAGVSASSRNLGLSPARAAAAGDGGRGGWSGNMVNHFSTPSGGAADPDVAVAQIGRRLRARALSLEVS